jgi:transcriptional regulator with XRE-family HTH domain
VLQFVYGLWKGVHVVAGYIKKRRGELGLSLADIAGRLSERGYVVQRQTVGHWETGRNNAPIESKEFRESLAASLEVDVNEMLAQMEISSLTGDHSVRALYAAEVIDRLPSDYQEEIIEYLQMIERRYLKKTAVIG